MTAYEIIAAKRDGRELEAGEIDGFIRDFLAGEITDYQMTAFLMAVYLKGMTPTEISALTRAYLDSGRRVDFSGVAGTKVDKHSTGGVGDKTSIILAPLVAALGVPVPMISGRGLGHSGGTLDKLESIPGFRTDLPVIEFIDLVRQHGLGLIGQTADIVPADKRIYALRDVTATVESIPLISASIMSKKIAEGIGALVLDVKYGNGAFMRTPQRAEELAASLIRIGTDFGVKTVAVLSDMNQPLGRAIGNWLEIRECLDCLRGDGPADLMALTYELAAHMVVLGGGERDLEQARSRCRAAIADGRALEKFIDITRAQGGDIRFLENPQSYPDAPHQAVFRADRDGFLAGFDTTAVGLAAVNLGAGRRRSSDRIDPRAGMLLHKKIGDPVAKGEPVFDLFAADAARFPEAQKRLAKAVRIGDTAPAPPPLIGKVIGAGFSG